MVMVKSGEHEFYMDDWLSRRIDEKVIPLLKNKDQDYVLIVDGPERSGKSTFAAQLAKKVDPTFNVDRECFSPEEFRNGILKAEKGQAVIFDEAWRGFSNKSTLSEVNKILVSMMMEMGQKNLFVIIVIPTFFGLEKYVALWRARCLFHIFKNKNTNLRFWRYFNMEKKNWLYLKGRDNYNYNIVKSRYKGKFYKTMPLDDDAYRAKKKASLESAFETKSNKKTKSEVKYTFQRDVLVKFIYEKGITQKEIAEFLNSHGVEITRESISLILDKFKKPLEY